MTIAILGRQPKIGLAELESVFGSQDVTTIAPGVALIQREAVAVSKHSFGGVVKLAQLNQELSTVQLPAITKKLLQSLHSNKMGMQGAAELGRVTLGFSAYGLNVTPQLLTNLGLAIKRELKQAGVSVRIVPNKQIVLNAAQVLHNRLTDSGGAETLLIKTAKGTTMLAQTRWVQNVDAYAERDFARPKRDAFVGMLPPKLAQTMLNLAGIQPGQRVLDPFCGTGVVLQEAALMDASTYGTDISQKMIDYSQANMAWLAERFTTDISVLAVADATTALWQQPIDHVVCETYLGQPLSGLPKPEKLNEIVNNCNAIIAKFLQNMHRQLEKGSRHCIAVPAWRVGKSFRHLPLLDHLEDLGYNRVRFRHARWEDLLYHREDQIVARELLVITVKE